MTTILNYGGGRQTVTLLILIAEGLVERPDYIVCADTGREARNTWDYLEDVARPYAQRHGLPEIHIAPHNLATVDLYGKNGMMLMPAFTKTGQLPRFCSTEWKARVIERYMRTLGVETADLVHIVGFAADERSRWSRKRERPMTFPLVDLMVQSHDCETIITRAGLPVPHKSACWCCPYRNNEEWRVIRDEYPAQWQEAIALDEQIRDEDDRGDMYLHHSAVPLAEANIDAPDRKVRGRMCGLGTCFV